MELLFFFFSPDPRCFSQALVSSASPASRSNLPPVTPTPFNTLISLHATPNRCSSNQQPIPQAISPSP